VAGILGFGIRQLLLPDTFGIVGHYRAGSLKDILNLKQVYQSKDACAQCHEENYNIHEKDVHYGAQCENCHGPSNIHIAEITGFLKQTNQRPAKSGKYPKEALKAVPRKMAQMPKEYTLEG